MKNNVVLLFTTLFTMNLSAQQTIDTARFETSVVCEMCEKRVATALGFEKGVQDVHINLDSKIVEIIYRTDKTSSERLKTVIAQSGYRADNIQPDPKVYEKLPDCCKNH